MISSAKAWLKSSTELTWLRISIKIQVVSDRWYAQRRDFPGLIDVDLDQQLVHDLHGVDVDDVLVVTPRSLQQLVVRQGEGHLRLSRNVNVDAELVRVPWSEM